MYKMSLDVEENTKINDIFDYYSELSENSELPPKSKLVLVVRLKWTNKFILTDLENKTNNTFHGINYTN